MNSQISVFTKWAQAPSVSYQFSRRQAASRHNDPELAPFLPASGETFDAENGGVLISEFFDRVEVERWDAPLVHLPDRAALNLYLKGRQLDAPTIRHTSDRVKTPLTLTKRGALFYARKEHR